MELIFIGCTVLSSDVGLGFELKEDSRTDVRLALSREGSNSSLHPQLQVYDLSCLDLFLQAYRSARENWLPILLHAMKNFKEKDDWLSLSRVTFPPLCAPTDFPLGKGIVPSILSASPCCLLAPQEVEELLPPSSHRLLQSFFEQEGVLSAPSLLHQHSEQCLALWRYYVFAVLEFVPDYFWTK